MLGRVGLYGDDLNACQRPDSKRPQALKSRVARAKRCGCGSAAAKRCGGRTAASLDSLHLIRHKVPLTNLAITAIPELSHPRPAALGYTERPARVQFMLGRVGLYIDVTYSLYRRLAKLQFMVWQVVLHCAAASGSRTAAAKRCVKAHCAWAWRFARRGLW